MKEKKMFVNDPKAFIFSIKNNEMETYDIEFEGLKQSICHSKEESQLFSFGHDLVIKKNEWKNRSFVKQFNSNEKDMSLMSLSMTHTINFTPKRIQVIQFYETEYMKNQKEKKLKEKLEMENSKLKEITEEVKSDRKEDIKQLEEWTKLTFKEVIFDSECWATIICTALLAPSAKNMYIFGKQFYSPDFFIFEKIFIFFEKMKKKKCFSHPYLLQLFSKIKNVL